MITWEVAFAKLWINAPMQTLRTKCGQSRDRVGRLAGEHKPRRTQRIDALGEQFGDTGTAALGVSLEDLGRRDSPWRIEEHVHGQSELISCRRPPAHFLGPFEPKRLDDNIPVAAEGVDHRRAKFRDRVQ